MVVGKAMSVSWWFQHVQLKFLFFHGIITQSTSIFFNILEMDCSTSTTGGPLGPTLVPKGQAAWIVNNLNGCTPACPSGMGHGVPMDPQSWSFSLSHRFEVRHLTHKQEIPLCKFRNSWVQKKCCAKLQLLLSRSCPFWLRQAESPNFAPGTRRPVWPHPSKWSSPSPSGARRLFFTRSFFGLITRIFMGFNGIQWGFNATKWDFISQNGGISMGNAMINPGISRASDSPFRDNMVSVLMVPPVTFLVAGNTYT